MACNEKKKKRRAIVQSVYDPCNPCEGLIERDNALLCVHCRRRSAVTQLCFHRRIEQAYSKNANFIATIVCNLLYTL